MQSIDRLTQEEATTGQKWPTPPPRRSQNGGRASPGAPDLNRTGDIEASREAAPAQARPGAWYISVRQSQRRAGPQISTMIKGAKRRSR